MLIKHHVADKKNIEAYDFKSNTFDESAAFDFGGYASGRDGPEFIKLTEEELREHTESSFNEGYEKGEKVGYENGAQSIQSHIECFVKLIDALRTQQEDILKQADQFVLDFCFKVLAKILGSEEIATSKIEKDKFQNVVKEALKKLSNATRYNIRVHKQIADIFDEYRAQVLENLPESFDISVTEDPSLKPGDCVVESDQGVVDARIESQLDEIKNVFKKAHTDADGESVQ